MKKSPSAIDGKFGAMDAKIDVMDAKFEAKIDSLSTKFTMVFLVTSLVVAMGVFQIVRSSPPAPSTAPAVVVVERPGAAQTSDAVRVPGG